MAEAGKHAVAALILAGGRTKPGDDWSALLPGGVTNRALLPLGDKTMLERVAEALQAADIGRTLVAGDVPLPPGCTAAPGGDSLVDTLLSGVAALEPSETRLLISTADIPFLTPEAVRDVLARAPAAAALVYPIIEARRCYEKFPQMKRTTLRVAEGVFTGGNLIVADAAFLKNNAETIRRAYGVRKSVPGLARLLGLTTLFRLLLSPLAPKLLPLAHLEDAVGRLVGGARVKALVTPYPEIGADIDRPDDARLARQMMVECGP